LPSQSMYLHGDLTRLAQVISNLLINSAKFTSPGGQIRLSATRESEDVLISVKDSGIGIAPENLGQIFEMFSQVSDRKQHHQGGLGIGLSLARGLVEMHGGQLTAHSAGLDQGSEFIVRLPACEAEASDQLDVGSTTVDANAGARCRILVVDDLKDNADSLASLLETMGHVVEVRYDGAQAIQAAEEFDPQIAFIDLGMPQVDGFEVCRRIRARPWGAKMYLVAQTGWGQEFDRRRTQAAGFDLHMVKPLELEALGPLLRRIGTRANGS
jgi:CheY-like chemotaxis protein